MQLWQGPLPVEEAAVHPAARKQHGFYGSTNNHLGFQWLPGGVKTQAPCRGLPPGYGPTHWFKYLLTISYRPRRRYPKELGSALGFHGLVTPSVDFPKHLLNRQHVEKKTGQY